MRRSSSASPAMASRRRRDLFGSLRAPPSVRGDPWRSSRQSCKAARRLWCRRACVLGALHMPVFFNNCRQRPHVSLFGPTAFYDLNTWGKQAEMATNLKLGERCIVASYDDDGKVVFAWFSLAHESRRRGPETGTKVRVFFGKRLKSERLSKTKAAKTKLRPAPARLRWTETAARVASVTTAFLPVQTRIPPTPRSASAAGK